MANIVGLTSMQDDGTTARRKLDPAMSLDDGEKMRLPDLKPVAAPLDTFVRPAQAPINHDLENLAQGLSALNPALQKWADVESKLNRKDAPDQITALTAGKSSEEVQGMVKSGQYPALNDRLNREFVGNVIASRQGDADAENLTKWYQTEYDRNSAGLSSQVDEYVAKRVQSFGNNSQGAAAYMERMAAFKRQLMARDVQDQVEKNQFQQAQTTQDGVLTIANAAIDSGESSDSFVNKINNFYKTNNAVTRLPYKEQVKLTTDALDPLLARMDREPEKRDKIFEAVNALATIPRKGEDGVERRLIDLPNGVGEVMKQKLTEFKSKRDKLNDEYTVNETAEWKYRATGPNPSSFDPNAFQEWNKAHPGAMRPGEIQNTLVAHRKALDAAAATAADYEAERKVKDAQTAVTSQDYQRFKDGDFLNPKDAPIPTKNAILSNGQSSETKPFTADKRREAVFDAFEKDLEFQQNKLVASKKATPEQAADWAEGQRLSNYSSNGMAPDGWKDSITRGMNQITTAISTGKEMPAEAMQAYKRYNLIASNAPNLMSQVTDEQSKTFFDVARAFPGSPADQLRAASNYYAKRDERTEKVKTEEVRKAVDDMTPGTLVGFVKGLFGHEPPENMGVMQDEIVKRAGIIANAYGASPTDAVKKAAEQLRSKYAVVNGWAVDTNDKRLPPNFEPLAERYIRNVVGTLGKEKLEAQSDKDITISSRPDGTFELFNKRTHLPLMEPLILQRRDGSTFDARFLSPDLIQEQGAAMRDQAEKKAVQSGKDRLQPLFVIPGTSIGMSRPSMTGYNKGEMATIQKNIDEKAARPDAPGTSQEELRKQLEADKAADAAKDAARANRTPKKIEPFIDLRGNRRPNN